MNTTNETNGTVTKTPTKRAVKGHVEVIAGQIGEEPDTRLKDEQRLASLESAIKKGWKLYLKLEGEIAEALQEIKNRKLYRYGFKTWEKYCQHVLKITARSANRALNAHDVRKIEASIRQAQVENEAVATENRTHADFRDVTPREARTLEGLESEEKTEAVKAIMQTPATVPPRTPRMPPPRMVLADTSGPEPAPPAEPTVQKATCPLDNAQIHWVVMEIERCYIVHKEKWNKIPPPAPMTIVSAIQHQLQKWKL